MTLDLDVNPVPQERARVDFRGPRARSYTPSSTAAFYEELRWALKAAGVREPLTGRLRLHARFWRRLEGRRKRGDLDNVLKALLDACNGHLFVDDLQIVDLRGEFVEWGKDVAGRIVVDVTQLTQGAA